MIIDCTEMFTEVPSSMSVQALMYSSYTVSRTAGGVTDGKIVLAVKSLEGQLVNS